MTVEFKFYQGDHAREYMRIPSAFGYTVIWIEDIITDQMQ